MDIQMTIVLAILYFAFVVWGYSKKSSGETLTDATPEQSEMDCGYVNYFPSVDDEDEEEFLVDSSSSSSEDDSYESLTDYLLVDYYNQLETEAMSVAVAVLPDPWTIETEVVPIEFEFNKVQLEYQLALPPAVEFVPTLLTQDEQDKIAVILGVDYEVAERQLMLSLMNIRQLKAEAKKVKLPRYGKMTKAELLSALKALSI